MGFQRIVLGGDTLDGFISHGFDNHTKVFFPEPGGNFIPPVVTDEGIVWADGVHPLSRDYTPLYSEACHKLALDFCIHGNGVASTWVMNACEGDKLTIGGPRGSLVVPEDYAYRVYVYDESGMPVLRRRLESFSRLAVHPHTAALVNVQNAAYQGYFAHLDGSTPQWFIGHGEQAVNEYLSWLSVPADDYFIQIASEGRTVENLCARPKTEAFDQ